MFIRFGFTSAEVATALDYATANGAHITNMSFGAYEFDIEEDIALKRSRESLIIPPGEKYVGLKVPLLGSVTPASAVIHQPALPSS